MGEVVEREEHEEHGGETGIQTHTRTQIGLSLLARTTNSIEVARKDLSVEVPRKDRRIETKRSRRVKRPRLIEVQAKDPKVEVQAKYQQLIEVTKEIPRIQQGDRVIQDLGSMVGFPTWGQEQGSSSFSILISDLSQQGYL